MYLYFKKQALDWSKDVIIYEELGYERYVLKPVVSTWVRTYQVFNRMGINVASIEYRLGNIHPLMRIVHFKYDRIFEVVKKMKYPIQEYIFSKPYIHLRGDWKKHDYKLCMYDKYLAMVSEAVIDSEEVYKIGISRNAIELDAFLVCMCIEISSSF